MASTALVPHRRRLPAARSIGDPHSARLLALMAARVGANPIAYSRDSELKLPTFMRSGTEAQLATYGREPTLYACVNRLSTAVSQVEWQLWRKAPSGKKEDRTEVASHAALDLLNQPNPNFTPTRQELIEVIEQHLELTGMAYMVVGTDPRAPRLPLSLWPIRPDRIEPVPSPTKFRDGWVYKDPEGRDIPFADDEVISLRFVDPMDPYHGMGPVRALLTDLDAARFQAEWTRNFFINSAQPGGLLMTNDNLTDDEFDELRARWNEQHSGVSNAHRVAILEAGLQWVPRSYSMKDMEFTQLRNVADERIMLAFGLSKVLLGQTEAVNRATAQAAEYIFSKYTLTPRLERIKQVLNSQILPRYFPEGSDPRDVDLEFDFESPIDADVELEARERESLASTARTYRDLGFDPLSIAQALKLPEMQLAALAGGDGQATASPREQAEMIQKIYLGVGTVVTWQEAREILAGAGVALDLSTPQPAPPTLQVAARARPELGPGHHHRRVPVRPRNAGDPPDLDPSELPDVSRLQETFEEVMASLMDDWATMEEAQKADLVAQVRDLAESGSLADLTGLTVDTEAAVALLVAAMTAVGVDAAEALVEEAEDQGVDIEPAEADEGVVKDVATVVAGLVAGRLVGGAAAAALRANGRGVKAGEVAAAVEEHLATLSTDGPRKQLAGALTGSQNDARLATLSNGPVAAVYATERNDPSTCGPCSSIDGKWLGNWPEDATEIEKLYPGGAYGGYVDCEGRENCRGTVTGVWRRGGR